MLPNIFSQTTIVKSSQNLQISSQMAELTRLPSRWIRDNSSNKGEFDGSPFHLVNLWNKQCSWHTNWYTSLKVHGTFSFVAMFCRKIIVISYRYSNSWSFSVGLQLASSGFWWFRVDQRVQSSSHSSQQMCFQRMWTAIGMKFLFSSSFLSLVRTLSAYFANFIY